MDSERRVTSRDEYPTRLVANIYLVVGIALLLVSSVIETDTLQRYLIGTGVEIGLAALALLAMRFEKLPIKRTARLHWPPLEQILLAVLAAPGLWILGILLNILSVVILGYVSPVPPSQFPSTIPEALALMMATLVAAPLCEELIFRGYVQRAYERRRVWIGVLVGGIIFALYHLRFQGVAAITPVALALSFIAWRTGSIVPGIALHAAYNAIATLLLVATSFLPMQTTGALTGALVCLSLLVTPLSLYALVLLWRRTQPRAHEPVSQPKPWLRWAWIVPLLGLAGVYGYAAITEVLVGRFPHVIFNEPLELATPVTGWDDPATWDYVIQNQLGDQLGTAICHRERQGDVYTLDCQAEHEGYDILARYPFLESWDVDALPEAEPSWWPEDLPSLRSLVRAEPESWTLSVTWENELSLRTLAVTKASPETGEVELSYARAGGSAEVDVRGSAGAEMLALPSEAALLPFEWAWRLTALPFDVAYGAETTLVTLDAAGSAQVQEAYVNIRGGEPAWTPAGTYVAWKVVVSWTDDAGKKYTQTAWYEADSPHTLVRLDHEGVSYVLASDETTSQRPETDTYAVLLRGRR